VRGKLGDTRAAKDELAIKFNRLSQRAASKPSIAPAPPATAQRTTPQLQAQLTRLAEELGQTKKQLEGAQAKVQVQFL